MTPITSAACQKALAKLRYLTKVRNESTEDIRLTLLFYAEELTKYPADVVRHVLDTQKNISPWWPAWSELKERLDRYTSKRRRLHEALTSGRRSPTSSPDKPRSAEMPIDPEIQHKAEQILAARKRNAENPGPDMTQEELDARRAEIITQCEGA